MLSQAGKLLASHPLPLAEDEDESALVDLAGSPDGTIYALRRGSPRIYRLASDAGPLEIGVPVRAMALWFPQRP